jgi:hypothetical protein
MNEPDHWGGAATLLGSTWGEHIVSGSIDGCPGSVGTDGNTVSSCALWGAGLLGPIVSVQEALCRRRLATAGATGKWRLAIIRSSST